MCFIGYFKESKLSWRPKMLTRITFELKGIFESINLEHLTNVILYTDAFTPY